MHLVFPDPETVVILSVAQHMQDSNPHEQLAEIFPGLSANGRRRSAKPPCCEDSGAPPELSAEAREVFNEVFGF